MHPTTNNWRQRRTEHRFHAETTTRISERKDTQQDNTKILKR